MRYRFIIILFGLTGIFATATTHADSTDVTQDTTTLTAQRSAPPEGSRFTVSIDRFRVDDMQLGDTIDIRFESGNVPIAGFELKIAIDSRFIDIVEVLPGRIPDSCGWEFFNARRIETQNCPTCPLNLWQIVALSETVPDGNPPVCYSFEEEASIARLVLSSEHAGPVQDHSIPIYFYWEDCTDNTISGLSGTTLALSRQVYHYVALPDPVSTGRFPNITGAAPECIDPSTLNHPKRMIDFHNGAIEFSFDVSDILPDSFLSR